MIDLSPDRADEFGLNALAAEEYAPRATRAIWLQIYDRLARAIDQRLVAPGSRLPGEVQLA
ncbi:MAG: GntR family transcriptional regulator, partial [Roseovarius indicus]